MRVLVTGGHGFVGPWLRAHLVACGDVVSAPDDLDVTDESAVGAALSATRPDAIYHLAAVSVPADAEADPATAIAVNGGGTRTILRAAAEASPIPKVLVTSTSALYVPTAGPLSESAALRDNGGTYVESKLAAEAACAEAIGKGLPVIVARAFNHTGPGQSAAMVVPAIAERVLDAIVRGVDTVEVGNLEARRDIADVRDVVRAYRLLVTRAESGVYNVCTGNAVRLSDLARRLAVAAGAPDITFRLDPRYLRDEDPELVVGDPSKLKVTTGWEPEIDLDTTLSDIVAWWVAMGAD